MNNCYFCDETFKYIESIELSEKTNTKTSCCGKYYCKYHENDLFTCSNCNNVYCTDINDCEKLKNKIEHHDKCGKCYYEYCINCFYKIDEYWFNNICKQCNKI